jgi:hypothetical protein
MSSAGFQVLGVQHSLPSLSPVPYCLFPTARSLFPVPCSLFPVLRPRPLEQCPRTWSAICRLDGKLKRVGQAHFRRSAAPQTVWKGPLTAAHGRFLPPGTGGSPKVAKPKGASTKNGSGSLCCSGALRAPEVVENSRPAVRDRRHKNQTDPLPKKWVCDTPFALQCPTTHGI